MIYLLLIPPGYLLAFLIWVALFYINVGIDVLTWDHVNTRPRRWTQ